MEKEKLRTVTFLTRTQIDYLDNLGKDVLFTQGHKLSRSMILAELVDFLMGLNLDIKKLDLNHEHLAKEILKEISQMNGMEKHEG